MTKKDGYNFILDTHIITCQRGNIETTFSPPSPRIVRVLLSSDETQRDSAKILKPEDKYHDYSDDS